MRMATLLFDIDMTLITTNGAGRATIKATLESLVGTAEPMDSISVHGKTDSWIYNEVLKQLKIQPTPTILKNLYATHIQLLPKELEKREGTILGGVSSLLKTLDQYPITLGLATGNLEQGAEIKLRHFELWDHFIGGGFGDIHKKREDVVKDALQKCSSAGFEATVIGDTPWDISSGKAMGTRTLGVATGIFKEDELRKSSADLVVNTLEETEQLLEFLIF